MQYGFPSYTGNYSAPAYQTPAQYSQYSPYTQPQAPFYGGGYGQSGQNLLSQLLGALGGIPNYGGYGGTMPQYPPVNYPPVYQPTYQQPAQANINVAATSPFGSASSIGSAIGGSYAATNGSAYTNYYGAGAQGSSVAYGQMPSYGGYGGYGGGYGGGYTPTQTYSQSTANAMTQYQPSYPSYPPVSMPPVLPPAPQPIYNYGSSLTSAVAGPGAYANGTAGTV